MGGCGWRVGGCVSVLVGERAESITLIDCSCLCGLNRLY